MGSSCVLPAGVEKPRETTEPDSHDVRCITSALADVSPYGCYVRTAPLSWEGREGEKEGRGERKRKREERKKKKKKNGEKSPFLSRISLDAVSFLFSPFFLFVP